jgi:hypothetical protein
VAGRRKKWWLINKKITLGCVAYLLLRYLYGVVTTDLRLSLRAILCFIILGGIPLVALLDYYIEQAENKKGGIKSEK